MTTLSLPAKIIYGIMGLCTFVSLWLSFTYVVNPQFLPTPLAVITKAMQLITTPFAGDTITGHLLASFGRYALAFALAVSIGVPLGLLMGWFRPLDYIVTPLFDALRFIAPIAWVPFAALWFGTGLGGPIMIIFFGAFPPCLINAYRGAKQVDKVYIEAAEMLGTPPLRLISEVLLPAATPSIISGLRVGAGLGWQSLVGSELIVASSGIGYMMVKGQASVQTSVVMAGMIAIGLVGMCIDIALRQLEQKR